MSSSRTSSNAKHSDKYKLYQKLTIKYRRAHPYISNQQVQFDVNKIWNHSKGFDNFESKISVHIDDLENKIPVAGIRKYFKIAARSVINETNAPATKFCNKPPLNVEQSLREDSSDNPQVCESNTLATSLEETSVVEVSLNKSPVQESSVTDTKWDSNVPTTDDAPAAKGKKTRNLKSLTRRRKN